eukprot:TCONS_00062031-protein
MFRVKTMMADDLKKSSRARLPKYFYHKDEHQGMDSSEGYRNNKYEELMKLNRSLIVYRDIALPDTIYGGRNVLPEVSVGTNELLQNKILKEANVDALEVEVAMEAYQNALSAQNKVEKESPRTKKNTTALLEELRIIKDEYSKTIEAKKTMIETHLKEISDLKSKGAEKEVRLKNIKKQLLVVVQEKEDLQQQHNKCLKRVEEITTSLTQLKCGYEIIQGRSVTAENDVQRLLLEQSESDIAHSKEVDALQNIIDGLTEELRIARQHIEEMTVDIQHQITDTTSHLKEEFSSLLNIEKNLNKDLRKSLEEAEKVIGDERKTRVEIERNIEKERELTKELIKNHDTKNTDYELERQQHLETKTELSKLKEQIKRDNEKARKTLQAAKRDRVSEMNAHKMDLVSMTHKYHDAVDELAIRENKEERIVKESEELHAKITMLEQALERERAEFRNIKETELKRNKSLVLTKVKESLSQTNILKKKLSRTEKEKKDIKKLLDNSGNVLADRLKEQNKTSNKILDELRQRNDSLELSNKALIHQLDDTKTIMVEKDDKMATMKKNFDREVAGVTEQLEKRLDRTVSMEVQKYELNQEQIQELKSSLDIERKLHQEAKQSLQEQSNLMKTQEVDLAEANRKKSIIKKKLFKATREVNELQRIKNEEVNQKIVQGQEALNKHQLALDALKVANDLLRNEMEDERKHHMEALARKEVELKDACDKLLEQAVMKENERLFKEENKRLRLAKAELESNHAEELVTKANELEDVKTAYEEVKSIRNNEIKEIMDLNQALRKDIEKAKCLHHEALADKESTQKELQSAIEEFNQQKGNNDKHFKKVLYLEKRLNQREVEIRARLEDISVLKKKEKSDQSMMEQQKRAIEKLTNNAEQGKRKFRSLVREKDAYKDEAHTYSMEAIDLKKKIKATQEHLEEYKKEVKARVATKEPVKTKDDSTITKKKKKKNKKKSSEQTDFEKSENKNKDAIENAVTDKTNKALLQPEDVENKNLERGTSNVETVKANHIPEKIKADTGVKSAHKQQAASKSTYHETIDSDGFLKDSNEIERPWSFYDTILMMFCVGIWFVMLRVCSFISDDDPIW